MEIELKEDIMPERETKEGVERTDMENRLETELETKLGCEADGDADIELDPEAETEVGPVKELKDRPESDAVTSKKERERDPETLVSDIPVGDTVFLKVTLGSTPVELENKNDDADVDDELLVEVGEDELVLEEGKVADNEKVDEYADPGLELELECGNDEMVESKVWVAEEPVKPIKEEVRDPESRVDSEDKELETIVDPTVELEEAAVFRPVDVVKSGTRLEPKLELVDVDAILIREVPEEENKLPDVVDSVDWVDPEADVNRVFASAEVAVDMKYGPDKVIIEDVAAELRVADVAENDVETPAVPRLGDAAALKLVEEG